MHLAWDDVHDGNKSFVITVFDPDAPTGSDWVVNIPADVRMLPQGARFGQDHLVAGCAVQGRTDFSSASYGGARRRHHVAIHQFYQALEIDTTVICCNGTYLYDYPARRVGDPPIPSIRRRR